MVIKGKALCVTHKKVLALCFVHFWSLSLLLIVIKMQNCNKRIVCLVWPSM